MRALCTALAAGLALAGPVRAAPDDKPARVSLARGGDRLPPKERAARAEKALKAMRQLAEKTQKLLAQARDEKDIVKLNCVGDKAAQVSGLLKVSDAAAEALRAAIERKEDDAAEHEFTKVQLLGSKVAALRADAEQCIGQLAFFNDEKTAVDVDVPKELPKQDPTFVPAPRLIESRPPPASGY